MLFSPGAEEVEGEGEEVVVPVVRQHNYIKIFSFTLREVFKKKNGKKAVRLAAWGGPDRFYFVKILTHFVLYKMAK